MNLDNLQYGEIRLALKSADEPDTEKGTALRYGFSIIHQADNVDIGVVYFAADSSRKQYLRGHLSYGVSPAYSGHNYAMKACRLLRPVALAHGFKRLFVGCSRDNIASRRTIEKLGAVPVTLKEVPDGEILRSLQEEHIDMYVWDISS